MTNDHHQYCRSHLGFHRTSIYQNLCSQLHITDWIPIHPTQCAILKLLWMFKNTFILCFNSESTPDFWSAKQHLWNLLRSRKLWVKYIQPIANKFAIKNSSNQIWLRQSSKTSTDKGWNQEQKKKFQLSHSRGRKFPSKQDLSFSMVKKNTKLLLLFPTIVTAYILRLFVYFIFFGPAGFILNRNIRKSTRLEYKKKDRNMKNLFYLVYTRQDTPNQMIK